MIAYGLSSDKLQLGSVAAYVTKPSQWVDDLVLNIDGCLASIQANLPVLCPV